MEQKNSIVIVGDLFPTKQNISYFSAGDINTLFGEKIVQIFGDADYCICNLEGALTDRPGKCKKTGPIVFAPTNVINAYKELGIDCCMLANNHTTDGGHQGLIDTMNTLEAAGIDYIGAGKNEKEIIRHFVKDLGGMRIGFYNVSETMYNKPTKDKAGAWLYDEYVVCKELEQLKQSCDYLIVIYHGGIEKFHYPSPELRKRFHRMADSGADMVLAQHTHCVGCEEWYNGSYLLYGQGNFLLINFAPGLTDSGLIIELDVAKGKVEIKKHLVKSLGKLYVRYDERQDLTIFYERSKMLDNEDYVCQQFQEFCDKELWRYFTAFKSPSGLMLRLSKIFPNIYRKWLYRYDERNLLLTLHTLRSEQNRETAIIGIENMLDKELKNNE